MNLLGETKGDDPVLGTLNNMKDKATAAAKEAGDKIKNVTGDAKKKAEELKGKIDNASLKSQQAVKDTLQKAEEGIKKGNDEWKGTQGENLWDKLINYLLSFFKKSATAVKETANKVKETSEKAAQDLKSGMAATAPPAPAAPPPQTGGRKFKKNQKEIYALLKRITLAAIKSNKKKRKTKKMRKKHKRKTKRRGRKSRNRRTKRRRTKRRR